METSESPDKLKRALSSPETPFSTKKIHLTSLMSEEKKGLSATPLSGSNVNTPEVRGMALLPGGETPETRKIRNTSEDLVDPRDVGDAVSDLDEDDLEDDESGDEHSSLSKHRGKWTLDEVGRTVAAPKYGMIDEKCGGGGLEWDYAG